MEEQFIPTENVAKLQEIVAKANRKGVKLGLPAFTLFVSDETEMRKFGEGEDEYFVEFTKVQLGGAHPHFNGYRLIAKIELTPIGSIAKVVPNEVLPERYLNHDNICNHCNSRRERKNNYIVLHEETGEYKSVGSTCLKDFLGGKDASALIWWYGFLSSFEGTVSDKCSMREMRLYDLETVLAATSASIREHGWTSSAAAREYEKQSTTSRVLNHLFGRDKYKITYIILNEDIEKAKVVAEYFKGITPTNDYTSNLKKIAESGYVPETTFGLVCSMINAYNKNMEFEKKKTEKVIKSNEYVGTVKERVEFELIFKNSLAFNGFYGVSFLNIFEDSVGNCFVWNTSTGNDFEVDATYLVKGTIKEHKEYNERKQTVLTRCKHRKI